MINIQYLELCQFRMAHPYHAQGISRDLLIAPTPATAQLMNAYKLRLHEKNGAIKLYYRYSDLPGQTIQELLQQEGSKLSFHLKINNAAFFGITALPEQSSGQPISSDQCTFYFHNRSAIESDDELVLSGRAATDTQSKFAQLSQADSEPKVDHHVGVGDLYWRLQAIPSWVELPTPEVEEGQVPTLEVNIQSSGEDNPLTFQLRWVENYQQWTWANYTPPTNLAVGLYEAEIEGLSPFTVIWDPQPNTAQNFGLLDLFLGPEGAEAATITTENTDQHKAIPANYRLQFLNRRVFARYHLIVRSEEGDFPSAADIQVQASGPPALSFSPTEEKERSAGEQKYQTISNELIPLLEQPAKGQYPTLQIANFPKIAEEITLPLPSYQNIRAERTATEATTDKPASAEVAYFADTYVYL